MTKRTVAVTGILLACGAAALVTIGSVSAAMAVEEPVYKIVVEDKPFQVREYGPSVIAEVTVGGNRREAVNSGFRALAGYIFGKNRARDKIAMTAPVGQERQDKGTKIDMTAPVGQSGGNGRWTVRFTMPAKWTLDTLPKPDDPQVRLVEVPARKVAAVTFSGLVSDAKLDRETKDLEAFVARKGLTIAGPPAYAYYDPPWTLPFLRRNEVMIPVR